MGIEYLFMTVVGGVGYVWGAIVGAGLIKLLDDYLQVALPALIGTSGSYEVIVFGVAMVLVLKYMPDGLWSMVAQRWPRAQRVVDWQNAADLQVRSKPEQGETVLQVQQIRKQFGGLVAVNDISFDATGAYVATASEDGNVAVRLRILSVAPALARLTRLRAAGCLHQRRRALSV
jgi:branched-chain amino acid transport system permease protein